MDGAAAGDAGSHKVLGTRLRAEKQFDLEERVLLEDAEELPAGWSDEEAE